MIIDYKVAVIIVNWNKYDFTTKCIKSVLKNSYKNFRIILIDNEYKIDGFSDIIKNKKIHLIKNEINHGFSRAVNQGIKYSLQKKYDYVLLLNNDTLIQKDLIKLLIKQSHTYKQKVVQPLILNFNATKIWNAGGRINNFFGIFYSRKKNKLYKSYKKNNLLIEWFTGCCVLIHSDIFNEIGYFDENFFAYYEDADFSLRLKKRGYDIGLMDDSYLRHFGSISSKTKNEKEGNLSPHIHYLNIRNHILVLKKHPKFFNPLGSYIYQLVKISSYLLYFMIRFRFNKFKMVLKAVFISIKFSK